MLGNVGTTVVDKRPGYSARYVDCCSLCFETFLFIRALHLLVFFYYDTPLLVTCVNAPMCFYIHISACQCAFCLLKHLGELRSKALRIADVESRRCVKYVESGNTNAALAGLPCPHPLLTILVDC